MTLPPGPGDDDPRGWGPDPTPAAPQRRHRAYWLDRHSWCDPDCFECGGEGAPCCDPPNRPYGTGFYAWVIRSWKAVTKPKASGQRGVGPPGLM